MKRVTGEFCLVLNVCCPYCESDSNLFSTFGENNNLLDDGWLYQEILDGDNFGTTHKEFKATCDECKKQIIIEEVVYR